MHVGNFQIPKDHLTVIEHPLEAEKVVFKSAQLGELVTCPLANWKQEEKRYHMKCQVEEQNSSKVK